MINIRRLEIPMCRISFHGPKDVRAIEVRLYVLACTVCLFRTRIKTWCYTYVFNLLRPYVYECKFTLCLCHYICTFHCFSGKQCPVTKRPAFRPSYGKLGELRSLAGPTVPVIALTATASFDTQEIIKKDLCLSNCAEVNISPNKPNIRYNLVDMNSADTRENFEWLVDLLDNLNLNITNLSHYLCKSTDYSFGWKY